MEQLYQILKTLAAHRVRFVVIGNLGASLHGANVLTMDADVACGRGRENRERLMAALKELRARYRLVGGVKGKRVQTKAPDLLRAQEIWNLTTKHGDLDLLYAPAGGGYEYLVEGAIGVDVGDGWIVLAASLDDIIASKELAGRPKDHQVLPELRWFRDQRREDRDGQ